MQRSVLPRGASPNQGRNSESDEEEEQSGPAHTASPAAGLYGNERIPPATQQSRFLTPSFVSLPSPLQKRGRRGQGRLRIC